MKTFVGDCRTWLVINTTEYNDDGRWAVQAARFSELPDLGFDVEDRVKITFMSVGDVLSEWDYRGVLVVRVS